MEKPSESKEAIELVGEFLARHEDKGTAMQVLMMARHIEPDVALAVAMADEEMSQ